MCIVLCASSIVGAYAVENENSRIVGGKKFFASLSINSDGEALCTSSASVVSGYTGNLKLELQRSTDEKNWTTIQSWTTSGSVTLSIKKYRYVTSGYSYRVKATFSTYSDGSLVETATANSPVQTY
jgi:hypothetical protein